MTLCKFISLKNLSYNYTQGTLEQWRALFLIQVAFLVFGALFFGYYADSEVEPWNAPKKRKTGDIEDH